MWRLAAEDRPCCWRRVRAVRQLGGERDERLAQRSPVDRLGRDERRRGGRRRVLAAAQVDAVVLDRDERVGLAGLLVQHLAEVELELLRRKRERVVEGALVRDRLDVVHADQPAERVALVLKFDERHVRQLEVPPPLRLALPAVVEKKMRQKATLGLVGVVLPGVQPAARPPVAR